MVAKAAGSLVNKSSTPTALVIIATISVTNMTGLRANVSAGRYCGPPRMMITPINCPMNSGPVVGNVSALASSFWLGGQ